MKDATRLVLSVSAALTSVEERDVDASIEQALRQSAALTGADRTYVFLLSESGTHISNTHEWCAPGIVPARGQLQRLPLDAFPIAFHALLGGRDLVVPRVGDTPPGSDRDEWEREGIQSLFCTPLRTHDRIAGFLGCDWVRGEDPLDDSTQELIRLTTQLVATAVTRRRALQRLEYKSGFEALVLRISTEFINLRGEAIRVAVHEAITDIAQYADFEGAYLFRFKDDGRVTPEYIWRTPPLTTPDTDVLSQPDPERFRWWRDRMRVGRPIALSSLDQIPADQGDIRGVLAAHGIAAVIDLPIRIGGRVWGFVGFATARGPRHFDPDEVQLLELAAQTLAGGIGRADADRAESELAAQLLQTQKMDAVGQLAGGVAHDFNNLLVVITLSLHAARKSLDKNPSQTEQALGEIQKATARATKLTKQLLTLSRQSLASAGVLDLNATVDEVLSLVRRVLPESVSVSFVPSPDVLRVNADATEIELCLLNLCVNARDAMPDGGTIALTTHRVVLRPESGLPPWANPGPHVLLAVRDSGHGMSPETRQRVFDPFFTTKAPDKGTGLGLSAVWNIVKGHGGVVRVESELGRGSVFFIYLPEATGADEALAPSAPEAVPGGLETVLLAEDDEMVRRTVANVLSEAGYRVLEAQDGEAAVQIHARHLGQIDLVVLDAVMPKKSGHQAFAEIAARERGMRVLFTSGYSRDVFPEGFFASGAYDLIAKPYAPETLLAAVRATLARAATPAHGQAERQSP
ncbi:MAG: response regulator [Polyangiaceae bacterium]|nr:response regulator [Polyangiaceae bacterium]